jgi:tRNA (cytidine/uridine-2'-O-)-methyltransferase
MPDLYDPLLHVVLYEPEIPDNAGNVGRTCVAAGAKLWLVRPLGFRLDDHHLRRAGMDYWQQLSWQAVEDWQALAAALPAGRRWLFTKRAARSYLEVGYRRDDVLVFGSESSGLPVSLLDDYPGQQLRIPIRADARSLNLSNSVAVVVFEALRQVGSQGPDVGRG